MPQTSYSTNQPVAYAGMKYDAQMMDVVDARTSGEASAEIPFGVFVAKKATGGDLTAVLPATNATLPIAGLVLHSHAYGKGANADLGDSGLKPNAVLNCMVKGRAWVAVPAAVAYGDRVHVFYAGSSQKGSVKNAAVASETFLLNNARFITSTSGAGFAAIEFDLTAGATAGS